MKSPSGTNFMTANAFIDTNIYIYALIESPDAEDAPPLRFLKHY